MEPSRRLPCTLRRCLLLLLALWAWRFGFTRVAAVTVLVPAPEDEPRAMRAAALYAQAVHAVEAGDHDSGIASYRASIDAYPYISCTYNNLAMLLFERSGNGEQALALLERGLREAEAVNNKEELVTIHNNMGYVLREAGGKHSIPHCVEATKHFDAALEVDSTFVEALINKASAVLALGEASKAETFLLQVLQRRPDHVSALIDLSRIYFERRDVDSAVELLDRIIHANEVDHDTQSVLGAIGNKAVFLREAGFTLLALRAQLQALEIAPDDPRALSNVMTMQRVLCDWDGLEVLEDHLVAVVTARQLSDTSRGFNGAENYVSLLPYDSTLVQLSDAFRRRIAQRYASSFEQPARIDLPPSRWEVTTPKPTRLRVGYLSFDFREHPMGHLTLALVETHDRQLVEVFCFSYGRDDASEWRSRFEQRCDVFRDLENATNLHAARQIASDEVDVLVDLMAHTKGARQEIPALEPSRVVVNYLGFPGTSGSKSTHFALVDKQVVPPEVAAETMTERVVYLPTTYQANQYEPEVAVCGACHHLRRIHEHDTNDRGFDLNAFAQCVDDCQRAKRPHHGLPLDGIVFCNFNVNSKMEARSFSLWMNILRQVPGSVLWLLAPHRSTSENDDGVASNTKPARLIEDDENVRLAPDSDSARVKQALRAQAAALGVSPSRIVFAPRVDKLVHLARVALADVFLDSLVYNAHSTASDALWAHVPLVTTWGDTFPSRVAASLINNAVSFSGSGASEMVAHSLKEYEHLAVLLARDPAKRLRLRAEMASQSLRCPLFDTERTTQGVERALEIMHDVKKLVSDTQLDEQVPGERRDLFHVAVTPELSRVWSDHARARARVKVMKQLTSDLEQAGDTVTAGNVGARIALANMHLQGFVSSDNASDQPTILVSVQSSDFASVYAAGPHSVPLPQSTTTNTSGSAASSVMSLNSDELREQENRVEASPEDFQAFMALASWQLERDRFADVVRMFETHGNRFLWLDSSATDLSSSPPLQDVEKGFLVLTFSLNRIGRTADAVKVAERALARYDAFFLLGYNLGALYRVLGQFSRADTQQSAVAEAESRHTFAEWRDDASNAHKLERKRARRPKDSVTIAFYCNEYSQSWWGQWGPSSARSSGLGGSEEAVVFLSQELARLGYWVEVYGSPLATDETPLDSSGSTSGNPSRVSWYPLASYDPEDRDVHVFIAWRYSVSLAVGKHARRAFFWAHDVMTEDTLSSALLATVAHRIVCVSAFQASFLPPKLRTKVVILRNAVDESFFTDGANDNHVFVYGSAPNRGLAQLLLAWPLVRKRLPNATLTVFYGFTPQFEHWARRRRWPLVTSEPSTEMTSFDEWRAAMHALLHETPGVTYVGLVDHSTLAEAYAHSGFWLFPTSFSETSCISAMKAMANGAVPLTSRIEESALGETIGAYDQGPVVINAMKLDDVEWWGTQWAERIAELVESGDELRRLRANMKLFARRSYRWSRVAREWHALITDELVG